MAQIVRPWRNEGSQFPKIVELHVQLIALTFLWRKRKFAMGEIATHYGDCEFFHKHGVHAIVDQISQGSMMGNLLFIEHWYQHSGMICTKKLWLYKENVPMSIFGFELTL